MKVALLAHTQLSGDFNSINATHGDYDVHAITDEFNCTDGQVIGLTAIRTCYSSNKPSEIIDLEGDKYFKREATDGEGGTDADRLIRHIMKSGHTSTIEHLNFTFAIEGVSRSLLAQITRHRHLSFSVQSQRYVKFGSSDKSEGFDFILPPTVTEEKTADMYDFVYGAPIRDRPSTEIYEEAMEVIQKAYDKLREAGVPAEDARMVLPNAATTNLVMTGNLRALLDFYSKRSAKGAQWEIRELADKLRNEIINVEPWAEKFFNM
ncbi:FAD-dependent thymidylate synthase [Priestia megaterium]|uniref:FAD-dependent thymidylate synthase n=1 Tax=Priestia megaterium TaxID=1404 RepID=UPI002E1A6668|nr:FAD-dependent thymidylate synthase [Priestia megaterium]